jgi:hypothetical protein
MSDDKRKTPAEQGEPPKIVLNPGDVAEPGTPGTGEDVCRECHGTGRIAGGQPCPNCGGTGKVIKGIGGAG